MLLKMNVPVHLSGAVAMDGANVIRISRNSLERMDNRTLLHAGTPSADAAAGTRALLGFDAHMLGR